MLLVVPLTEKFRTEYAVAWRRLAKDGLLTVMLYDWENHMEVKCNWNARIVENTAGLPALKDHPTDPHELVMFVSPIPSNKEDAEDPLKLIKTFNDRSAANRALLKDQKQ
ncbi:hypothetical protein LB503_004249 [Fusarium chuoi]|nr:hypothetical protein LB503_004249 [Fusarium chuoi]